MGKSNATAIPYQKVAWIVPYVRCNKILYKYFIGKIYAHDRAYHLKSKCYAWGYTDKDKLDMTLHIITNAYVLANPAHDGIYTYTSLKHLLGVKQTKIFISRVHEYLEKEENNVNRKNCRL